MKYNRCMENETQGSTPTPDQNATAGGSTPNCVSKAPMPGAVAATTPPAHQLRARPRRERGIPVYHPTSVPHVTKSEVKPTEEFLVPEDAVHLDYEFVLRGGREEVVRVKSQLILPMALALENLPQTDVTFPELVDQVIVRPLVAKFRSFLQRRFDAASRAAVEKEAAGAVEPPFQRPVSMNVRPPKPTNGATFTMPELDAKPPLPQRPGSRDWAGTGNGV